jgi:hypothetical protein
MKSPATAPVAQYSAIDGAVQYLLLRRGRIYRTSEGFAAANVNGRFSAAS